MRLDMLRLGTEGRRGRPMTSTLADLRDALFDVDGHVGETFLGHVGLGRLSLLFAIAQKDYGCRGFSLEVPGKAWNLGKRKMDILHVGVQDGLIQTHREGLEAWPLFSSNQMLSATHRADASKRYRKTGADVWAPLAWIQAGYAIEELLASAKQHLENGNHPVTISTRRAGMRNRRVGYMRYQGDDLMTRVLTCSLSPLKAVPMEGEPNCAVWAIRSANPAWSEAGRHLTVRGLTKVLSSVLVDDGLHPHPLRPLREHRGVVGDVARCEVSVQQ